MTMLRKFGFKNNTEKTSVTTQSEFLPFVPGILPIKSLDDLLSPHFGRINQIDELAGLSADNFTRFYLFAIRHFARFVQQLPASEVHHHAGSGGMLSHTLEVCVIALKVRRSYLLSETGGAEEISAKQDVWTYAVFLAALCHDLAKVAVDQIVTIYDSQYNATTWEPWNHFLDEQGRGYVTEFVRNRHYRLHEKAAPLLIHKIIPAQGMSWLASDRTIFSRWLASISGDLENASAQGEIVGIADGQSVATNLGADGSGMPDVKTIPLHEKMLTALRFLLLEGELPLNRNGAAGWIKGVDCWLVSRRTVDAIREQLLREGHTGVPTKNGRLFDVLQERNVLIPCGVKAIWTASIEGEDWSNELTMIKIPISKIWTNPERRPAEFDGRIIPCEIKTIGIGDSAETQSAKPNNESILDSIVKLTDSADSKQDAQTQKALESSTKNVSNQSEIPVTYNSKNTDDSDLLNFLPSMAQGRDNRVSITPEDTNNEPVDANPVIEHPDEHRKLSSQSNPVAECIDDNRDPVDLFFDWLQNGIGSGEIKTNQPKARIHRVKEGVALMTPGIFQDFATSQVNDLSKWTAIQKKVLKKTGMLRMLKD